MPNGNSQCDALVIGGGIVGLSCALALQSRGIATHLVAPASMIGTASWGNAGHIATEQVEPLASLATVRSLPRRLFARGGPVSLPPGEVGAWLPFALRLLAAARPSSFRRGSAALAAGLAEAMPAWRRLVRQIGAEGLLVEDGHFIMWESAASAARGRASWASAPTGTATVRDATDDELARIGSLVRVPIAGGLRFTGSGQIADPTALAEALEAALLAAGATRRAGQVLALAQRDDGSIEATVAQGGAIVAKRVVVAGGAASGDLLRPLGHRVPLIAERGYHIQSEAPGWPATLPPVVFEDRAMIVTRFRTGLRAASFTEFGAVATPADPRKWARLHAHASDLGLPIGEDAARWMGARPTLPDYLPAIGRSRRMANLFYAFGHQHLGLTLGPLTGELIGALATGDAPAVRLEPFDLERFERR